MCRLASFLHNPSKQLIAVWDLQRHSQTQEHLGLTEAMGWYEGHYLPNGEILCRIPGTDSTNVVAGYTHDDVMEAWIREKYPIFVDFVEWALKNGAQTPDPGTSGWADLDLFNVLDDDHITGEVFERLRIAHGYGVNTQSKDGYTALSIASAYCNLDVMAVLIKNGADVNHRDRQGTTPLLLISYYIPDDGKRAQAADLLLKHGADINAVIASGNGNRDPGMPALHVAASLKRADLARFLINAGADTSIKDKKGNTVYDYMSRQDLGLDP